MRAWILAILLILAGLVLAVGIWLLGYHLSGKWAFDRWKAERVAMGDRLDWKDLVPPSVSADENFAEAPLIRGSVVEKGKVDPRFKALEIPKAVTDVMGNWKEGRKDDLEIIAAVYGTKDLETVFKPLESILMELDRATRRPASRFPIDYQEGEIPALIGFRSAVRTLRLCCLANLRAGHSDQALEGLQTCFRMADHLKAEPHLISALLRLAVLNFAMQVVWEGTEDHLWSASDLEVVQAELSRIDLLATSRLAWQGERQGFITVWTAWSENQPTPRFWTESNDHRVYLSPLGRGWFYRNMLALCQFETSMVDVQDPLAHRIFPDKLIDPLVWLKGMRFRKDLIMAQIAAPALTDQVIRFAQTQALIDEAVIVCALERYRLDKGHYADHLEALLPNYSLALPHDLVTGGPLHYARRGDSFSMYQVGWDRRDDGGMLGWVGEGKERKVDPAKGDWVWPHANP